MWTLVVDASHGTVVEAWVAAVPDVLGAFAVQITVGSRHELLLFAVNLAVTGAGGGVQAASVTLDVWAVTKTVAGAMFTHTAGLAIFVRFFERKDVTCLSIVADDDFVSSSSSSTSGRCTADLVALGPHHLCVMADHDAPVVFPVEIVEIIVEDIHKSLLKPAFYGGLEVECSSLKILSNAHTSWDKADTVVVDAPSDATSIRPLLSNHLQLIVP